MRKRVLALLAALAIALPLPAEDTSGSLVATNDGNFHFSLMPTVEIGKLVTTFNFTFYGECQSDYPWVSFDFSNYQVPEKGSMSKGEYHRTVAEQYAGFIYSMHYGERYDSFYFRYGKLENITLGDGALLSSYYDYSVGYLESRPGLNLKLGPWGRFGQELVVEVKKAAVGSKGCAVTSSFPRSSGGGHISGPSQARTRSVSRKSGTWNGACRSCSIQGQRWTCSPKTRTAG